MKHVLQAFAVALPLALPACYYSRVEDGNIAVQRVNEQATCEAMGYFPGNAQYDRCVISEKKRRASADFSPGS